MISNLNGSGSVRVHQNKAVFTGLRFRFGFGSTPWLYDRQYGFRDNHSVSHALLDVITHSFDAI